MRYSRLRKGRTHRRYIFVLITGLLIFTGIYIISAGTAGKYISKIIAPILDNNAKTDELADDGKIDDADNSREEGMELVLPEGSKENEESAHDKGGTKITETIVIEPIKYFGIQMGAFNGIDNARLLAGEIQGRGGAGYIIEDGYFRVMGMAFTGEKDAKTVQEQLKKQAVESQIYEFICPGVNMEITASKEKVDGIKSSFIVWKEKAALLETTIRELDSEKITGEISLNKLREIRKELAFQMGEINQYSAANESSGILKGLQQLFEGQVKSLDQILESNMIDRVAISSKMKYTYIDMIYLFRIYMEQITKG